MEKFTLVAPALKRVAKKKAMFVPFPRCPICSKWSRVRIRYWFSVKMKKYIFSTTGIVVFTLFTSSVIFAHGMPVLSGVEGAGDTGTVSDGHTAIEEAEGKTVWEKLQAKQTTCADLSDDNFETLGEYFMGQMLGTSHEAMNNMMIQMLG